MPNPRQRGPDVTSLASSKYAGTLRNSATRSESGTAMVALLFVAVLVGGLVIAHLGELNAEQRNVQTKMFVERAQLRAKGELERAKNIVNAAAYANDKNTALAAAIAANPPYIPGTEVLVTELADSNGEWFMLQATGQFKGISRRAQAFVRQRSPVSAFNFFVVSHPLGISGAPRGAIHSNKSVNFYFPWGAYRDQVTASEGFSFRAGATPENTRIWGAHNPNAPVQNILDGKSMSDLAAKATDVKVTEKLIAEIEFVGDRVKYHLFRPSSSIQVEKTGIRQVFDHYEDVEVPHYTDHYVDEQYSVDVDIYIDVEETYTVTVDDYESQTETYVEQVPVYDTRMVEKTVEEQVWVEDPPPTLEEIEGGTAVAGEEAVTGHWETVTTTVMVEEQFITGYIEETKTRTIQVKVGSHEETRTRTVKQYSHTEQQTRTRQVYSHTTTEMVTEQQPVYRDESYTYYEWETVPEEDLGLNEAAADGVLYFEGDIRKLSGTLNGQVSLVSNDDIEITGSIQYVDANGNTRMLNGLDETKKYSFNPEYQGNSVLGIMARDRIEYSKHMPSRVEINASLISLEDSVRMEGISVSSDGETVSVGSSVEDSPSVYVKESIRRLGGIVSDERPVTTYVDDNNNVVAGFKKGISFMDRNMILEDGGNISPPFVFQMNRPLWSMGSAGKTIEIR